MAITLNQIRSIVTREVSPAAIEHESIMAWCNDLNMDIGSVLNVPGTTYQIALTTTDFVYPLPTDLKEINRMTLQSDIDADINREIVVQYRIYNGQIEFPLPFPQVGTLNIDYYKFLTYFTDQNDVIDFPDRFVSMYTSYCKMRYYELDSTRQQLSVQVAQANSAAAGQTYLAMRNQAIQNYTFTTPDLTIRPYW